MSSTPNNYYPLLGNITAYRAGLITYMPEGQGERKFDADILDVIPQGKVCILDKNATPPAFVQGDDTMTGGRGQIIVSTKEKIAGESKIVGVGPGFRVLVEAGDTLTPYCLVQCDADGNVEEATDSTVGGDPAALTETRAFAQYTKWARKSSSNDGNHALQEAQPGDLVEITIL